MSIEFSFRLAGREDVREYAKLIKCAEYDKADLLQEKWQRPSVGLSDPYSSCSIAFHESYQSQIDRMSTKVRENFGAFADQTFYCVWDFGRQHYDVDGVEGSSEKLVGVLSQSTLVQLKASYMAIDVDSLLGNLTIDQNMPLENTRQYLQDWYSLVSEAHDSGLLLIIFAS